MERKISRPTLLALDLDDTLLHRDLYISQANIDAIHDAENAGIKIVLASGRNLISMRKYADILGLNRPYDFLICSNGAEIVAADTNTIIEHLMLPRALCHEVTDAVEARGFTWQIYIDGNILCSEINPWALHDKELTGQDVVQLGADGRGKKELFAEGQTKFVIPGEPDRIAALYTAMRALFGDRAEVVISKPYFLEVLPKGADKGSALSRLAASLGISMSDVMAVGDAMNDLSMIQMAGWGCAPANAVPMVLAAANVISSKTNDEDAVADLIRKIALAPAARM